MALQAPHAGSEGITQGLAIGVALSGMIWLTAGFVAFLIW